LLLFFVASGDDDDDICCAILPILALTGTAGEFVGLGSDDEKLLEWPAFVGVLAVLLVEVPAAAGMLIAPPLRSPPPPRLNMLGRRAIMLLPADTEGEVGVAADPAFNPK